MNAPLRGCAAASVVLLTVGLMACDAKDAPEAAETAMPAVAAQAPSSPPMLISEPIESAPTLSAEELALEPEETFAEADAVDVKDAAKPLSLEVYSERGYEDSEGRLILDLLERDYAYMSLLIRDAEGRPVQGARPVITTSGESRIVPMAGETDTSDGASVYSFGVAGGEMGTEDISIILGSARQSILLNVISLRASGYSGLSDIEGALDWSELVKAEFKWGEVLTAKFPASITQRSGETVRLAGFMMPLEMRQKQAHFVMTSNPPDCFFHIPGGPAGAVEVFASKAIPVSWDPIVLEGRFEALSESESGVLYRLHDAKVVKP